MKNERPKPNNPAETQATTARTQIAAQNSELGSSDSTGNRISKSLSTAAADMPRRSGSPRGSGEVLERDRGSKSPVSLQPPPRGANKIYTYDVVFSMGGSQYNPNKPTAVPLYADPQNVTPRRSRNPRQNRRRCRQTRRRRCRRSCRIPRRPRWFRESPRRRRPRRT